MSKPQWEYLLAASHVTQNQDEVDELNSYGSQGWELVTVTKNLFGEDVYYLKRPVGVYPLEGEVTNHG